LGLAAVSGWAASLSGAADGVSRRRAEVAAPNGARLEAAVPFEEEDESPLVGLLTVEAAWRTRQDDGVRLG